MINSKCPRALGFLVLSSRSFVHSVRGGMEKRLKVFQEVGLSEQKAKETAKNEKLASQLAQIIDQVTILNAINLYFQSRVKYLVIAWLFFWT